MMSPNISVELGSNITVCSLHITVRGILLFVLYGHDTRYFTLREERGLRWFKNWLLRKITAFKNEAVIGSWKGCLSRTLMMGKPYRTL